MIDPDRSAPGDGMTFRQGVAETYRQTASLPGRRDP
jgi:hypothetical protein